MKKFNIGGKEIEIKKITVGEWLKLAKLYDAMSGNDETNYGFVKARLDIIGILFGLTEEEVNNLPAEGILSLYVDASKEFQESLAAKFDEKKSETETQTADA